MSIVYIYIVPFEPFGIKLIFKLIPMLMITYYAVSRLPKKKLAIHWLILIGLGFSMIGDATIHWFVIGLSAFLIGHLFYISGFITQLRFSWRNSLIVIPLGIYGFWYTSQMIPTLKGDGHTSLVIPVIVYIVAISLMALSASLTGNKWALMGSLLFVISDSILAWNKFIQPVDHSHALIMLTYYGAQFCIAHSLQYLDGSRTRLSW